MNKISMWIIGLTSFSALFSESLENTPILWGTSVSPYVRKVEMALKFKKLPFETRQVLPTNLTQLTGKSVSKDFNKVSPLGKIPAYQEGEFSIADSSVIIAYLDKAYPKLPLYPVEPHQFARALWLEKFADTRMTDVIYQKIFVQRVVLPAVLGEKPNEGVVREALEKELPIILSYLETKLSESSGKFLVGDQLTIADLAIINHLINLNMSNVKFDLEKFPMLADYQQQMKLQPAVHDVLSQLEIN